MKIGDASIHGTLMGCLVFGMTWKNHYLWFRDDDGETRINYSFTQKCLECGTVVMRDEDFLIDKAYNAEDSGDIELALKLYQTAVNVGIQVEHARERIEVLKSKGTT